MEFALKDLSKGQCLILDTDYFDQSPLKLKNGQPHNCAERCNNQGEADNAVWHHAFVSPCETIICDSGDSDVYLYGLAIQEICCMNKRLIVKRSPIEYVFINRGVMAINDHTSLQKLSQPCLHILLIYLLSGCDYLPNFYNVKGDHLIDTLIRYGHYISPANSYSPLITCD